MITRVGAVHYFKELYIPLKKLFCSIFWHYCI